MVLPVFWSKSFLACHREVCWVLFCSTYIPVKCLRLVENWLYAYADDSTLLAVVSKPADRPVAAASLNWDLVHDTEQKQLNHWCLIMNPNKTKALVVSRSRTVNHPKGDLVLSGASICASSNLDIFGVKFDSRFTFEDHVRCSELRPQLIH